VTPPPVTLEGQDAIKLWRQGKEAWNAWVAENPVADVSFSGADFSEFESVSFAGYGFPTGRVDFSNAGFGDGDVDFRYARFGDGDVSFSGARFGEGRVNFANVTFGKGRVDFSGARFGDGEVYFFKATFGDGRANFSSARFGGHFFLLGSESSHRISALSFYGCIFESAVTLGGDFTCIPDLRGTTTKAHVDLQGLRVSPWENAGWWPWARRTTQRWHAAALRRLKEIAEANRHHDAALRYHADEKRATRWNEYGAAASLLDWSYDMLCNYGQSVFWPAVWLLGTFVVFAGGYALSAAPTATRCGITPCPLWDTLFDASSLSLANIVPFVPAAQAVRGDALDALFGADPGFWIDAAILIQGVLGVVFLFLIGLGLRNRFRI